MIIDMPEALDSYDEALLNFQRYLEQEKIATAGVKDWVSICPKVTSRGVNRESPTKNYVTIGRSFFSTTYCRTDSLGDGLECWRGFYQSIRPTHMGLSLNIGMLCEEGRSMRAAAVRLVREQNHQTRCYVNSVRATTNGPSGSFRGHGLPWSFSRWEKNRDLNCFLQLLLKRGAETKGISNK